MPDDKTTLVLRGEVQRKRAIEILQQLPVEQKRPFSVTFERYRDSRSLAQNALYWKWLGVIAQHLNDNDLVRSMDPETGAIKVYHVTTDDLHDEFRGMFLPTNVVMIHEKARKARTSTRKLKVDEFSEYLDRIERHCIEQWGLILPHPEDQYYKAMGWAA